MAAESICACFLSLGILGAAAATGPFCMFDGAGLFIIMIVIIIITYTYRSAGQDLFCSRMHVCRADSCRCACPSHVVHPYTKLAA